MLHYDDCDICGAKVRNLYHNDLLGLALCDRCDIAVARVGDACYSAGAADARAAVAESLQRQIRAAGEALGIKL